MLKFTDRAFIYNFKEGTRLFIKYYIFRQIAFREIKYNRILKLNA